MYFFAGLFGFIGLALAFVLAAGFVFSAPGYRGALSDHFNGKTFSNYDGVRQEGTTAVLRWMMNRDRTPWQEDLSERYGKRPLGHFRDGIRISFVNHSTFLIQVDGVNILTDPVWSKRVSPVRWAGPKRMKLPGIRFEDLPPIHVVLISHNHYDHLDEPTLRLLAGAHHPHIIVPLGVKRFLDKRGIGNVSQVDWWEEVDAGQGVSVQALPAQHFSGRGLFDRNKTLWCGFVIKTSAGHIYFAGDTGYNERMFADIAAKAGPIRLSLLPIGAYRPEWFMSPIHTSPAEAVRAHKVLKARESIAIHFGTFPMADDGQHEPVEDLREVLTRMGVSTDNFLVLSEGEYRVFE